MFLSKFDAFLLTTKKNVVNSFGLEKKRLEDECRKTFHFFHIFICMYIFFWFTYQPNKSLNKQNEQSRSRVSSIPFCRKSMPITQSQFLPVSSFSQLIGHWPAQAAYREKLGLAYVCVFSAKWSNIECGQKKLEAIIMK